VRQLVIKVLNIIDARVTMKVINVFARPCPDPDKQIRQSLIKFKEDNTN